MLTTPVIKDEDTVFPGENWFLYWKTSASLWKSKIENLRGVNKVIIPLNWGFHSDTGDKIDFAGEKPETDLKRLIQICEDAGKEPILLLPISPVPYLANGGIPFLLARTESVDEAGMNHAVVDSEGVIHQFYSFYDPRIFKAYTKFTRELSHYISQSGINVSLWAFESGSFTHGHFKSYLNDQSQAFEQGFLRFLQAKKEELGEENFNFSSVENENELKQEYANMIRDLYLGSVSSDLSFCYGGSKKVAYVFGEKRNIFLSSIDHGPDHKIIDEVLAMLRSEITPSTMLVPARKKTGLINIFRETVLGNNFIEQNFEDKTIQNKSEFVFHPSTTFSFVCHKDNLQTIQNLRASGIVNYVEDKFRFDFDYSELEDFSWEDELESSRSFYFFTGKDLNLKSLSFALKMFMNGLNVFIDKRDLDDNLKRRLESFYLENDLEIERIKFLCLIETISMGEGRLFIFDSSQFEEIGSKEVKIEKKYQFWQKVFYSLEIKYPHIEAEEGLRYTWFDRGVASSELKFEKIKRLSFFNPTSYKKKVLIKYPSQFIFQKSIDEKNVSLNNTTHEIELYFLPKGSISLDFGVIL